MIPHLMWQPTIDLGGTFMPGGGNRGRGSRFTHLLLTISFSYFIFRINLLMIVFFVTSLNSYIIFRINLRCAQVFCIYKYFSKVFSSKIISFFIYYTLKRFQLLLSKSLMYFSLLVSLMDFSFFFIIHYNFSYKF